MVHWDTECTGRGSGMAGDWDRLQKMVSKLVGCIDRGSGMAGNLDRVVGSTSRCVTQADIVAQNRCCTGRYYEAGTL